MLSILPQGYCKIFGALAHVDCEIRKWQANNGIKGINVKPYQKVSNNRFQIFLSFVYTWLHHSASFTIKGVIIFLLKIPQETPIQTRNIYNFTNRHAKIMINLSEPTHVISNNILNLHGHKTHRSQDIITSSLNQIKSYLFISTKTWHVLYF